MRNCHRHSPSLASSHGDDKRHYFSNTNEKIADMKTVPDFMHLRVKRSRFAQLGVAQSILEVLTLGTMNVSTTGTVMLFGWLLLVNGVVEAVQAFQSRKPIGFFLHVIPGIAVAPICLLMATRLAANELAWTILFGSIFMVVGLFRITVALAYRFPGLGLDYARWRRNFPARESIVGGLALVGVLVFWVRLGYFTSPPRLVIHHICAGSTKQTPTGPASFASSLMTEASEEEKRKPPSAQVRSG
jgi:hypothetical protein